MDVEAVVLSRPLLATDQKDVPSELVIFPPGVNRTTKYPPSLMDAESARDVIAAFERLGRDIPIDYEHQTLGGPYSAPDGKAPAAGWINSLIWDEQRGLIAMVRWTERAAEFIRTGEYRYFSPVGLCKKGADGSPGRFTELWHVALTNDPATIGIEPIAASRRVARGRITTTQGGSAVDRILTMLGLGEDASFEDLANAVNEENLADLAAFLGTEASREAVLAKIRELMTGETGDGTESTDMTEGELGAVAAKRVAKRLEIDGVTDEDTLVKTLRGRLVGRKDAEKAAADLRDELVAASDRIEKLELTNARLEFDKLCETEHAGKIPPADADAYFEMWRGNAETFATVMKNTAAIADGKPRLEGGDGSRKEDDGDKPEWELMVAKHVADGHAKNQLEAIRVLRKKYPEKFEAYRNARRADK